MNNQSNTAAVLQFPYAAMSTEALTALCCRLASLKCPRYVPGKNKRNGIVNAIPFPSYPTMFSYWNTP